MAKIKISDRYPFLPKWAAKRVTIDMIETRNRDTVRTFRPYSVTVTRRIGYDPNLPVHADSDVWGR